MAVRLLGALLTAAAIALELLGPGQWLAAQAGRPLSLLPDLGRAALIHAAAVGLGGLGIRLARGGEQGPALGLLTVIVGFFIPLVGLPAMGLISILQRYRPLRRGIVEQYRDYIDRDREEQVEELKPLDDVVTFLMGELSVEPLADLLASEDHEMRRAAIEVLRRLKNPTAIRLLRQALKDPNPEVRVYATGALTRVDAEMNEAIESAAARAERSLGDMDALLAWAEAMLAYVRSGLLDPDSQKHYLTLAEEPIKKALEIDDSHSQALDLLGQVSLLQGRPRQAQKAFEKIIARHGPTAGALAGLAEALYEQGEYGRLAETCRNILKTAVPEELDHDIAAAVEMWAQ